MKKLLILIFSLFALSATPAIAKKAPQLTPMELQALQSREFETSKDNLFGAVMTVFQDLGYQVQTADVQTGFITAVSATQNKTNFFMALGGMSASGNTKVTCFLQAMPSGMTRVRLNFLNSRNTSSAYGQSSQVDKQILDAAVYHNAWEKIDEALFVMGALQATAPAAPPAAPVTEPAVQAPNSPAPATPN
jgi:hypothetical protein